MNTLLRCSGVIAALSTSAVAQQHPEQSGDREEVKVTATALDVEALEMIQATTVLTGKELAEKLAGTIGETLETLPGVQSAYFGPGVGRPIIRGLEGSRVGLLENNIGSNDASAVSADHAVSIEPFLADQVEVLRGPATLLYGSDTIGGVVNVRTNRIPVPADQPLSTLLLFQHDTVSDGEFAGARIDYSADNWGFHADGYFRDSEDYEIPGFAGLEEDHGEDEGHEEEEGERGILENSAVENQGGAIGTSYFGDGWRVGAAVSAYETDYGIPGGHGHEEEHEGEEEEEEFVSIDLEQTKYAAEFSWTRPVGIVDSFTALASFNNYQHTEFEGDEVGTQFDVDTIDSRFEVNHRSFGGWSGALGFQYTDREFEAIGEEAFVPPSDTSTFAAFLLEEHRLDDWRLEFGARFENQEVDSKALSAIDHDLFSVSGGAVWHFSDNTHLNFAISRTERAPSEEALLSNGPHVATASFEIGDPGLGEETATHFEIGLHKHLGAFQGSVSVYRTDFSDFVYLTDTGLEEDELPVRLWQQQDADFRGAEAEASYRWDLDTLGELEMHAFYDTVDAELEDDTDVPRLAPSRFGVGIDWRHQAWTVGLNVIDYAEQDDVAPLEESTDGYTLLSANFSYRFQVGSNSSWDLFFRARNVTNEEARNHTSLLKESAPLPGRNIMLGLRAEF